MSLLLCAFERLGGLSVCGVGVCSCKVWLCGLRFKRLKVSLLTIGGWLNEPRHV